MTTEIVDPQSLRVHPLLQEMPAPPAELEDSILHDLDERGQDYPLLVDEQNRVLDGRIRLRAAVRLNWDEIRIERRSSADAATIKIQTLIQRRHYTKLALAYLAMPVFESMLIESRNRRLLNLIPKAANSSQMPQKLDSAVTALSSQTAEQMALSIGVSRRTFFDAKALIQLFRDPKIREIFEPKILSGELGSWEKANVAINGHISTAGIPRQDDQYGLFDKWIDLGNRRFAERWQLLNPKERRDVLLKYTTQFLPALPTEFHRAHQKFLAAEKQEAHL